MILKIYSAITYGIDALIIPVEINTEKADTFSFHVIGLSQVLALQIRKRIHIALKNNGIDIPDIKITVNLGLFHGDKTDAILFDLPIAIGILQCLGEITLSNSFLENTVFIGELGLEGSLKAIKGALSIAIATQKLGKINLVLPYNNRKEAQAIDKLHIYGIQSLSSIITGDIEKTKPTKKEADNNKKVVYELDFVDVKGQYQAKRAMQIAAAGRHNLIMMGPPGSGKTMLAQRLSTILPSMNYEEMIEATRIYSSMGNCTGLVQSRPFRSPHHTASIVSLLGGGINPQPGEISLAHNGVLFLDEFTEFKASLLEALRQPLEDRKVTIIRRGQSITYPASFLMVAAFNPCPCGHAGDSNKKCECSRLSILKYLSKLSGPILDRIDLQIALRSVEYNQIQQEHGQSSAQMKENIIRAIQTQQKRGIWNSQLSSNQISSWCIVTPEAKAQLEKAFTVLRLSMRGYHKLLRVARTIADIEGCDHISLSHINEALTYRNLDQTIEKMVKS